MSGNIFKSMDGGSSWGIFGRPERMVGEIDVDPFHPQDVWVCATGWGIWGGLWKYASGVWTQVSIGNEWEDVVQGITFNKSVAGRILIGTHSGGYQSTNGGVDWTPFGPAVTREVIVMAIDPIDSQVVYQGQNGPGIYKTIDDGLTWEQINQGLAGVVPNSMAIEPGSPETVYALADLSGLYKSVNAGSSWLLLPALSKTFITVDPFTTTRVYGDLPSTLQGGGVTISVDGGESWHDVIVAPPPQYQSTLISANVLIAPPTMPGHLVLGAIFWEIHDWNYEAIAGGFYTSEDFGETWSFVDLGYEIGPVFDMAFNPENPSVIYAATEATRMLKSIDGGATWQLSSNGLEVVPYIEKVEVEQGQPYRVFAGYGGAFFISSDDGASWVSRNLPPYGGYGVQMLYAAPGIPPALFASSGLGGLYRSTNAGLTWQRATGSLGYALAWIMSAGEEEDRLILYVGTSNSTVSSGLSHGAARINDSSQIEAGVYRLTSLSSPWRLFLPAVVRR